MVMSKKEFTQEVENQTTVTITEILKKIRLDRMRDGLARELKNKENADGLLAECRNSVNNLIESNRGGAKGMHGFIGERAQCYICNIRSVVKGEKPLYVLIDDNGMTDYLRGDVKIQQKACMANGHLGLDQVLEHFQKYPLFKEQEGIYQIPKDMYAKYAALSRLTEEAAGKLLREDYRLWKYITAFRRDNPDVIVEPMAVDYKDIQAGNIFETLNKIEEETRKAHLQRKITVIEKNQPTLQEGVKVTACSAAMEGGAACVYTVVDKAKEGKNPTNYEKEDWIDIGKNTAVGAVKGGVRGTTIYVLTNFTEIPAPVAAAAASIIIDTTVETTKLIAGESSREEYVNAMISSVGGATSSAAGAMIAKKLFKKNPLAGLIGGLVGNICWQAFDRFVIVPLMENNNQNENKNDEVITK